MLALLMLLVGAYVAYLFLDYHRLEDNLALEVTNQTSQDEFAVGQTYSMMPFNIGYGF